MWKELVPEQNSGVQFPVYVAHPDEILVAKFRLTSGLGRQSQRPSWAVRGCTAARVPEASGCQHWGDWAGKKPPFARLRDLRS